ncbi:hypothetical protein SOVF_173940 [Spinacia oleracea]|nr:hypothetical protein SOVF_173940 [Spinacia oleracea]
MVSKLIVSYGLKRIDMSYSIVIMKKSRDTSMSTRFLLALNGKENRIVLRIIARISWNGLEIKLI